MFFLYIFNNSFGEAVGGANVLMRLAIVPVVPVLIRLARVGQILSVRVKYDRETGKGKGFGYITFTEPRFAQAALGFNGARLLFPSSSFIFIGLLGAVLLGRPVRVEATGDDGGPPAAKELGRHDPIPVNTALPVSAVATPTASLYTTTTAPTFMGLSQVAAAPAPAAAPPAAAANPLLLQVVLRELKRIPINDDSPWFPSSSCKRKRIKLLLAFPLILQFCNFF